MKPKITEGWKIKPLVFIPLEGQDGNYWRTFTRYGKDYQIDHRIDSQATFKLTLWVDSPVQMCRDFDSFEAASADAQRDFDAHIVSVFTCS